MFKIFNELNQEKVNFKRVKLKIFWIKIKFLEWKEKELNKMKWLFL